MIQHTRSKPLSWLNTLLALSTLVCGDAVLGAPRDLDFTFANKGELRLGSGNSNSTRFLVVQADNRVLAFVAGLASGGGVWRLNSDGTQDTTFGDGKGPVFVPDLAPRLCGCEAVVVQPDGKIIVVVLSLGLGMTVTRILPSGMLDPTFGDGGAAFAPLQFPVGVAVQGDGHIVVGGAYIDSSFNAFFVLARFLPDGRPDVAFGPGGVSNTQIQATPTAFMQQPDGTLLIAGFKGAGAVVARFQADGELDSTFASGGIYQDTSPSAIAPAAMAVQPDGATVVVGSAFSLMRLDPTGHRDFSFGTDGQVTLQVDASSTKEANAVALDSHQRIVVVGTVGDLYDNSGGFRSIAVARLNPDGWPDAFFAPHGVATLWDGYSSSGYAVAIDSIDRIMVGGTIEAAPQFITGLPTGQVLYQRYLQAALFRLQGGDGAEPLYVSEGRAIEYYDAVFGHYFVTATPDEIASLDTYSSQDWMRTGKSFNVWTEVSPGLSPVCRFFSGQTFAPKSSHFYTPYPEECAALKAGTVWEFEGVRFELQLPQGTLGQRTCSAGTAPLYRLYNNGQGGAPNHRYTDDLAILNQMLAEGWIFEGEAQTMVFACIPQSQ